MKREGFSKPLKEAGERHLSRGGRAGGKRPQRSENCYGGKKDRETVGLAGNKL